MSFPLGLTGRRVFDAADLAFVEPTSCINPIWGAVGDKVVFFRQCRCKSCWWVPTGGLLDEVSGHWAETGHAEFGVFDEDGHEWGTVEVEVA